jgi:hypothetical protein
MGRCSRSVIALVVAGGSYARAEPPASVRAQATGTTVVSFQDTFGYAIDIARIRGVSVAIGTGYEAAGFNTVPAVVPRMIAGANLGGTRVTAQLAYGAGLVDDERYGDAQLVALRPVSGPLAVGAGSRVRVDLQHEDIEPVGERAWQLDAGPTATVALGQVTITALAGMSAWRWHQLPGDRVGAIAQIGIVSTF